MDAANADRPSTLIDLPPVGMPAPVWFIEFFKWLGFTLHEVPMNLWYAGIFVLHAPVRFRQRAWPAVRRAGLMAQMPVIIAVGINFGIVPLLFIQVGFGKVFYPATILMAWFWFSIIAMLVPAYYGVYIYAYGQAGQGRRCPAGSGQRAGSRRPCSSAIGFIFANAMSLMENVKAWPDLWQQHSFHGAALGTALNLADPRLWPRWLLMFGLALTTTPPGSPSIRPGSPPRERGLSRLGQGFRLETLPGGHSVVRGCRLVVRLRHLAAGNEAGDVPCPWVVLTV